MAHAVQDREVVLEACENFQKQSYRSRCHIYGPNGLQKLSFPVEKDVREIKHARISYAEPWVRDHLKALETAYRNAPFFDVLFPDIEELLLSKPPFLFDLNRKSMRMMWKWMELEWQVTETTKFERVTLSRDVRYLHPKDAIPLHYPPYPQVFSAKYGFLENLSTLDLFFNLGRSSWDYLDQVPL